MGQLKLSDLPPHMRERAKVQKGPSKHLTLEMMWLNHWTDWLAAHDIRKGDVERYIPTHQYQPFPDRRFRIDWCFVPQKVSCEVDGGTWMPKGGHNTGAAMKADFEKGRLLSAAGFRQLHWSTDDIREDLGWKELAICLGIIQ